MAATTSPSSPAIRPLACFAALNASCQGLVGIILSILALCVCFCGLGQTPQAENNNFGQYITYYLQGNECGGNVTDYHLYTKVTGPTALRVWTVLSLFFSVSMLASSIALVIAVMRHWSDERLQITLVSWLFINGFTAIDDLILGYLFTSDFSTALKRATAGDNEGPFALGFIAFLALRGGYLWLMNVALILYLTYEARGLHMHINQQTSRRRRSQPPQLSSWPTLDDFGKGKSKEASIDRDSLTPTAINPRLAERVENGHAATPPMFPEHSALARWPTLNGQAHTMRERSGPEVTPEEEVRDKRSKTVSETTFRRLEGEDNPGFESDLNYAKYYFSLQSESGSTREFEEYPPPRRQRSIETDEFQESRTWELSRRQDREAQPWQEQQQKQQIIKDEELSKNAKKEFHEDPSFGQFKQRPQDPWRKKVIPAPPPEEYGGVPIPPVDYEQGPEPPNVDLDNRPYSLQEAILDRTLRLKKVPDELKKGLKY